MTLLQDNDTFNDWKRKINEFHNGVVEGFNVPSQSDNYDLTPDKFMKVGAFGLGEISTTTSDTLDLTGTRFDFVSQSATSNFSIPNNFLGGMLVTFVNNGQGFQIIQNDDDLNFRTVYNDIYEEWVSFKNILDDVSFGITQNSISVNGYLNGVDTLDNVPSVDGGGTLSDAMNQQSQSILNILTYHINRLNDENATLTNRLESIETRLTALEQ